jgi:hypothetical protein
MFCGHENSMGWRLVLAEEYMLSPAFAERFTWSSREQSSKTQLWLTGVVGQQLDLVELAIEFTRLLAEPGHMEAKRSLDPDGSINAPQP